MNKITPVIVPISPIFENRWSPRSFDPNREILEEDIIKIFEAARWTPSCFNEQPWRFIVCNRLTDADSWERALQCLGEWNQGWAKNCQVLTIICHDTIFERNAKNNKWSAYDTGAAAVTIAYQAIEMGIHSHQMGGFDEQKTVDLFQIPDRYKPISVIALGFQGDLESLDEDYKKSETDARKRKEPKGNIFNGKWDKPLY